MENISLNQAHQLQSAKQEGNMMRGLMKLASTVLSGGSTWGANLWDLVAGNDVDKEAAKKWFSNEQNRIW